MSASGSYSFDPSFAGLLDEALERAGMDPSTIGQAHITSAKRSLNFLLAEWAAIPGATPNMRLANSTATVASGTNYFNLATGAIDVVELMISEDNTTFRPITRTTRSAYLNIPDVTDTGTPYQYYVDHSTLNAPKAVLFPVPDATVYFKYDYLRRFQAVTAMTETVDIETLWLEAVVSGLALRIAKKYNIARIGILQPDADRSFSIARNAGAGSVGITISGRAFGVSRTRRR